MMPIVRISKITSNNKEKTWTGNVCLDLDGKECTRAWDGYYLLNKGDIVTKRVANYGQKGGK